MEAWLLLVRSTRNTFFNTTVRVHYLLLEGNCYYIVIRHY